MTLIFFFKWFSMIFKIKTHRKARLTKNYIYSFLFLKTKNGLFFFKYFLLFLIIFTYFWRVIFFKNKLYKDEKWLKINNYLQKLFLKHAKKNKKKS